MNNDNIYDKLKEIFGNVPGNLSVLEEQIDVDLQMEYFEFAKTHRDNLTAEEIIKKKDTIFEQNTPEEDKKSLFVQLASLENVDAYKTIEKYLENPDDSLREWATLAYQESRMLLESKILNENRVFISTGLGGKGTKLRYFIVFISKPGVLLNNFHRRVIKSELDFLFKKFMGEIEEIKFTDIFATITAVLPLNAPIKSIFKEIIFECNQYGNFLQTNFIITNIKYLSYQEITDFILTYNQEIE